MMDRDVGFMALLGVIVTAFMFVIDILLVCAYAMMIYGIFAESLLWIFGIILCIPVVLLCVVFTYKFCTEVKVDWEIFKEYSKNGRKN